MWTRCPEEAFDIRLCLLAGDARLPLPRRPEFDDIISRNFGWKKSRTCTQKLLEKTQLLTQFSDGGVAALFAFLCK
jgi:hypothetical protein